MKPRKVTFYVYAEDDSEITLLEKSLHNFVLTSYNNGLLITASKIIKALNSIVGNPIFQRFLK